MVSTKTLLLKHYYCRQEKSDKRAPFERALCSLTGREIGGRGLENTGERRPKKGEGSENEKG